MSKCVLFLHGLGGDGKNWQEVADLFEDKGWRCEAPTLFQHLRTTQSPPSELDNISINDWLKTASDYADQLEEEEGEPPVVIGHCLGGFIAQKLIEIGQARAGVFISPLALNASQIKARKTSLFAFASTFFRASTSRVRKANALSHVGLAFSFLNRVAPDTRHDVLKTMRHESSLLLNEISNPDQMHGFGEEFAQPAHAPSLFIGCGKDRIISALDTEKAADMWADAHRDTTYKTYSDIGHWPFAESGTERMFGYAESWLSTAIASEDISATPESARA